MRKALLFLPLAFALVACGPTGCDTLRGAQSAANAPSRTVIDDKTVLAAEVSYGAALDTVIAGAKDGRIKGQDAENARKLIAAVETFRHPDGKTTGPTTLQLALKAGNSTDLLVKFNAFKALVGQLAAIGAK